MKIKQAGYKMFITFIVLIYAATLSLSSISCPFLTLFKTECPGCGMTRALLCALRFDFSGAFSHHLMFWSVPILYLCFLLDRKLFKKRGLNICFYTIIFVGFLINWII